MNNIVAGIEPARRRRNSYKLTLDDGRYFIIHEEIMAKRKLQTGMEVDSNVLAQWIDEADSKTAYDMSLRYLGFRARSTKELIDYLNKKGFSQKIIDDTINKLQDYKFLDDADFAKRWINDKKLGKPSGKRLIAQELKNKGISSDILDGAMEYITDEDEEEQALRLAERYGRKYKDLPKKEFSQKVGQALLRRGFGWDTARTAINKAYSDLTEEDDF